MSEASRLNLKLAFRNALVGDLVTPIGGETCENPTAIDRHINSTQLYIFTLLITILIPVSVSLVELDLVLPAVVATFIVVVLIFNIYRLGVKGAPILSPAVPLLAAFPLILILVNSGYDYGIFFLYPVLVAVPGILRTTLGMFLGLACLVALGPMLYLRYESIVAIIIFMSMIQTLLVSWWLMNLVNRRGSEHLKLIMRDSLTQAYNRRFLEMEISRAHGNFVQRGSLSTLILFDIDNFKQINDRFGHPAGDVVLKELVKLIQSNIRRTDILCRLGGDEFALLLCDSDGYCGARIAEKLRLEVSSNNFIQGHKVTISASVCNVIGTKTAVHWLKKADEYLYQAKRKGRDRVTGM